MAYFEIEYIRTDHRIECAINKEACSRCEYECVVTKKQFQDLKKSLWGFHGCKFADFNESQAVPESRYNRFNYGRCIHCKTEYITHKFYESFNRKKYVIDNNKLTLSDGTYICTKIVKDGEIIFPQESK